MVREGHSIAPALVQEGVSSSPKLSLNFHSDNKTKRPRLGLKLSSVVWDRFSREKKKKKSEMCYISDWPKRFLKPILLQLSRHQVCMTQTHTQTHAGGSPPLWPKDRTTGEPQCVSVVWRFLWFSSKKEDGTRCLSFLAGGVADWKWSREGLPVRCPPHVSPVSTVCLWLHCVCLPASCSLCFIFTLSCTSV